MFYFLLEVQPIIIILIYFFLNYFLFYFILLYFINIIFFYKISSVQIYIEELIDRGGVFYQNRNLVTFIYKKLITV